MGEQGRRKEDLSRHREGMEQRQSSEKRVDVRCDRRVQEQRSKTFSSKQFEKDEASPAVLRES
jgi:hypothetical protein